MYNSGYPQAKYGTDARKIHRPKGKSCGYYMKIVFFFSSLIQSLIIVSLVLFLVYGQPQESAAEKRVQELEQRFSKSSVDNVLLRLQRSNLTRWLNLTQTEKLKIVKELSIQRILANTSSFTIKDLNLRRLQCEKERLAALATCYSSTKPNTTCRLDEKTRILQNLNQQLENVLKMVQTNFTQTIQQMKSEMAIMGKDRDTLHLEVIGLRRDKFQFEKQKEIYDKKCKEDFVKSLEGIPNVTKAFMVKIDTLVPQHFSFQLTCPNQKEQLDQIRSNCSSLSREVESRLQIYLDNLGSQVTDILGSVSALQARNIRLAEDFQWCSQNRSAMASEHHIQQQQTQMKQEEEVEKLLMEKRKLRDEKELQETLLVVKNGEINILNAKIQSLNASLTNCVSKPQLPITWTGTGLSGPGAGGLGSTETGLGGTRGAGGFGMSSAGIGGTGLSRSGAGGTGGWGPTGTNSAGLGGAGSSSTGLGKPWGLPSSAEAAALAKSGLNRVGAGGINLGSVDISVAGAVNGRVNGPGTGGPNSHTSLQAHIDQHLKQLQKFANPSGSEVSG